MPMRVNDESIHFRAYQMIERKSDQRFLENWDERLGAFVR